MDANFQAKLKEFGAHLVEIKKRPQGSGKTTGFVVNSSAAIVLFHRLEPDTFRLNGYTAIRTADINAYRVFDRPTYWEYRAIRHLKLKPCRLFTVSIESLAELLTDAASQFPLLTIHRERIDADACWIGPLLSRTRWTFTIDDLNAEAEWVGTRTMKFSDVTRVDFGGGYEAALAAIAPRRQRSQLLSFKSRA